MIWMTREGQNSSVLTGLVIWARPYWEVFTSVTAWSAKSRWPFAQSPIPWAFQECVLLVVGLGGDAFVWVGFCDLPFEVTGAIAGAGKWQVIADCWLIFYNSKDAGNAKWSLVNDQRCQQFLLMPSFSSEFSHWLWLCNHLFCTPAIFCGLFRPTPSHKVLQPQRPSASGLPSLSLKAWQGFTHLNVCVIWVAKGILPWRLM